MEGQQNVPPDSEPKPLNPTGWEIGDLTEKDSPGFGRSFESEDFLEVWSILDTGHLG
jgi:hypothetical protein